MRWLADERGLEFDDYDALWRWSVSELEDFWASIWDFFEVEASAPYSEVLGDARRCPARAGSPAPSSTTPSTSSATATTPTSPSATPRSCASSASSPGASSATQVARAAAGLRELGIGRGDRVVAYMPEHPGDARRLPRDRQPRRHLVELLARLRRRERRRPLRADRAQGPLLRRRYRYGGRDFDRTEVVAGLQAEMPTLERTVVLPYLAPSPTSRRSPRRSPGTTCSPPARAPTLEFEQVPFDHPLWVLYSSGTTGLPKAIVQGHGGILLEQLKKLNLHVDAQEGDRLFWFTTTGWMMWNFLVGGLLTPASIVLYDGSPGHPDMGVLWDLAERAGITCFGTSASYIAACMNAGVEPGAGRDLVARFAPSAPPARRSPPRASSGSIGTSAATPGSSRPAAAPMSAPPSSAASRCCRCTAASSRAARSAPRSRRSTRTATRSSTRSANW